MRLTIAATFTVAAIASIVVVSQAAVGSAVAQSGAATAPKANTTISSLSVAASASSVVVSQAAVGSALAQGGAASAPTANPNISSLPFQFTPQLPLVDSSGSGGSSTGAAEPSIRVDSGGHIYVTGPVGVPTGGCPLWYVHPDTRNAQGKAYEYRGKFDTDHGAAGGGDCDLATGGLPPSGGFDNLAASSLSLADVTVNQSADGGATFHTPANSYGGAPPGADRQWNAADTGLGQVYNTVHDVATSNIQVSSSTDGGYTYLNNTPAIQTTPNSCGIPTGCFSAANMANTFGNLVINKTTHKLYSVYVATASPAEQAAAQVPMADPNQHVVYVAVGDPCAVSCTPGSHIGPISWTDYVAFTAPAFDDLDRIFPSIAIDSAGAVYVTYSDTHRIYLLRSTAPDTGVWGAPVAVSGAGQHSAMFPWIVGGGPGIVDLVWYSAEYDQKNPACALGTEPSDDSSGVENNCHDKWLVDFAQAKYGNAGKPTSLKQEVLDKRIHNGSLCDLGLGCTTSGGDRTLLDFFQVALDPLGAANIAYASDLATPGTAQIMYQRQCTGPSANNGLTQINYSCAPLQKRPPPPPPSLCDGTHVLTDVSGDAANPAGAPGSTDQVDITNVAFAVDNTAHTLTTTMTITNLTAPPQPIAGTADTYYYVGWSFAGHTYATLASEPQPDATAFSYGEFNPANNQLTTANAATGVVTPGTPGTIAITVPLSGIGNPTIPATTLAKAGVVTPFAYAISGEGALGGGLVFTHPDDRAPNSGFGSA